MRHGWKVALVWGAFVTNPGTALPAHGAVTCSAGIHCCLCTTISDRYRRRCVRSCFWLIRCDFLLRVARSSPFRLRRGSGRSVITSPGASVRPDFDENLNFVARLCAEPGRHRNGQQTSRPGVRRTRTRRNSRHANAGPDGEEFSVVRQPSGVQILDLVKACEIFWQNNLSLRTLWPVVLRPRPVVVTHQGSYCLRPSGFDGALRLKRAVAHRLTGVAISEFIANCFDNRSVVIPNPYKCRVVQERNPGETSEPASCFLLADWCRKKAWIFCSTH